MHLPNLPIELINELKEKIKRQEGSIILSLNSEDLFKINQGLIILFEVESGEHYFRIERDEKLYLNFYHSSPGTGTRVASVNISILNDSPELFIILSWSPDLTRLGVGGKGKHSELIQQEGIISNKQFRISRDGQVWQIGDDNIEILHFEIYKDGKPYLQQTAYETWVKIFDAINLLLSGESKSEDNRFNTVVANMAIVMMITGFESYCKRRFIEIEGEGKKSNFDQLFNHFSSTFERENNYFETIILEAKKVASSPTKYFVEKNHIDFQNFDKCKKAYNKAYNIIFSRDLDVDNQIFEKIKRLIKYRHRIVHYSIFEGSFNIDEHDKEPIFTTKDFAFESLKYINTFLTQLHKTTIKITIDRII